jgi:hypothetical protein
MFEFLEWCWYAYKTELFCFIGGAIIIWIIYCLIKQGGFAVG